MKQDCLDRLIKYFKEYNKNSPFESFFNLEIDELQEGKSIYKIQTSKKHTNRYEYVHGGTLSSICDVAMGAACITLGKKVVTIDMNISYLKPTPNNTILTAIGEVVSRGNTIIHTSGKILDEEGQLLVRSQGTYYITGDFEIED